MSTPPGRLFIRYENRPGIGSRSGMLPGQAVRGVDPRYIHRATPHLASVSAEGTAVKRSRPGHYIVVSCGHEQCKMYGSRQYRQQERLLYVFRTMRLHGIIFLFLLTSAPLSAQVADVRALRPQELNLQYHRALTAFHSGASLLEAKARVDIVLADLPDDTDALKLRADILLALDRPTDALRDAGAAVRLNPLDGEAHVLLCESAVASGNHARAVTSLTTATELFLGDISKYVRLSACAVATGQIPEAEALARIAMATGDKDGRGRLQLARIFMVSEREESAVAVLQQGLQERALRPSDVRRDTILSPLMERPELAPFRLR